MRTKIMLLLVKPILAIAVGWLLLAPAAAQTPEPGEAVAVLRLTSPAAVALGDRAVLDLTFGPVPEPGLGAWAFDIEYDPTILSPVACNPNPGGACNTAFQRDTIRFAGASGTGLTGGVRIGNVVVQCVSLGASELRVSTITLVDVEDQPYEQGEVLFGTVSCLEFPVTPTSRPTEDPQPDPTPQRDSSPGGGLAWAFLVLLVVGGGAVLLVIGLRRRR